VYFSFGIINKVFNTILVLALFTTFTISSYQPAEFEPKYSYTYWIMNFNFNLVLSPKVSLLWLTLVSLVTFKKWHVASESMIVGGEEVFFVINRLFIIC
jgi:hypothetical protein